MPGGSDGCDTAREEAPALDATQGGMFILEPQPWKSYRQALAKQDMSKVPHFRLSDLSLRPESFPSILSELGLCLVRSLTPKCEAKGFTREILVFRKS